MSTPTRSCIICNAPEWLEDHHVAFRENLHDATVPVCREHHAQLHELLRRHGVMPNAGGANASAQVLWAFVCGFALILSTWEEMAGAMELVRRGQRLLGDIARLVATLDGEHSRLGPHAVGNAMRTRTAALKRPRSRSRHQADAQPQPEAQTPATFALYFASALATAVKELLGGVEQHAEFVQYVETIASGTGNLGQAIPHIESHPRLAELERVRARDEQVMIEMPRCLLRLVRTEIKGMEPDPTDIELLHRFAAIERRWKGLLSGLAADSSPAEAHHLIDSLLARSKAS